MRSFRPDHGNDREAALHTPDPRTDSALRPGSYTSAPLHALPRTSAGALRLRPRPGLAAVEGALEMQTRAGPAPRTLPPQTPLETHETQELFAQGSGGQGPSTSGSST